MFRKSVLALVAAGAFSALASTSASAGGGWHGGWGHHHHHHHHGLPGAFWRPHVHPGPAFAAFNPCWRKRWVATPHGMRLRPVNVCVY